MTTPQSFPTPGPGDLDPNDLPTMGRLPRWLKPANRVIELLQRLGLAFFTFHLISVPGRKTGRMRTTPVSPLFLEGRCYIVSIGQTEWVKNARVSSWGILARGRRRRRVQLAELGLEERKPVLRQFPVLVPHGVPFLLQVGAVQPPGDADAFEAAAPLLAVFEATSA
jgi:hypothetical protein